jgi:hypothetical protein
LRAAYVRDVVVVVVVHLVVALLIGLALPYLADLSEATRTSQGVVTSEVELGKQFNDDGWLIVLGGLAGLVLGLSLLTRRHTHEVVTLVAVVVAALLGSLLAGWVAEATGPADPVATLAEAEIGARAPMQVEIGSRVAYLVWPLMAAIGALVALLARTEGRREDDPRSGSPV